MSKDWLYVVYNIFIERANFIALPEFLWKDFCKFTVKRKPNKISILIFWAHTLQKLYSRRSEAIPLNSEIRRVYCSFKTIKTYRLLIQSTFGPIRCLPEHMLSTVPSK